MNQLRLADFFALFIFSLSVLIFHIFVPDMGFKSLAFGAFTVATMVIILIPVKWGIIFTFLYIGFEGFLKVVSGYHPVIHVGSDVLVIFLALKIIFGTFTGQKSQTIFTPPLAILFLLHFSWVIITLFNPYSLGLIPSLAGAKVYITMVLLYFFGYSQTRSLKDANDFLKPLLFVVLIHTIFGIYQGMVGEQSVLTLHPGYAKQLEKYQTYAFRPFGLTNLPGGPAVYLSFMFPLVLYVIFTFRSWLIRGLYSIFLPAGVFLFLLCQIRASMIKMIIGCTMFFLGLIIHSSKNKNQIKYLMILLTIVTAATIYFLPQFLNVYMDKSEANIAAVDRSLTIFDIETLSKARRGALQRFLVYAQAAPFGAGFSRIGGAAAKFSEQRSQDQFFASDYFFADNFWIACLVELGIPGMLLMTVLVAAIWWSSWKVVLTLKDFKTKMLALSIFSAATAMIIGLYGSEGILYNPDACFFWFFSGVLLKLPIIEAENAHLSA